MRIIYLCPLKEKAYGGIDKIIYHSSVLNSLGGHSLVYDLKRKSLLSSFFKNTTNRYKDYKNLNLIFSKNQITKKDIVIIPEIYVKNYAPFFIKKNIIFSILIQGPFLIKKDDLYLYEYAAFYISISNFVTRFVKNFINYNKKIIELRLSANFSNVHYKKKKIITFMPRKLNSHVILFFERLKKILPHDWKLVSLDNLSNKEVINNFKKSSIFLSLTDLEGFGLPALEAGVNRNLVVGYSAQGSNEYFKKPLFYKVPYGDLFMLEKKIFYCINKINNGYINSDEIKKSVASLQNAYSPSMEIKKLENLLYHIDKFIFKN